MNYRFIMALILSYGLIGPQALASTMTPRDDLVGTVKHYTVREQDNLYAIARRYDVGFVELLAANPGVDAWAPTAGLRLTLPTAHILPAEPRTGIVVNLSELRLFYYAPDGKILTFPIGIGRKDWETPEGSSRIVRKRAHPSWTPPASIREESPELPDVVPPGPENPLGDYALDLALENILIHGTNRPYGVGKRSSHGCIRLYPEDIAVLFEQVPVGTEVAIIDTPFKLGWRGDELLLEVTPTQTQTDAIARYDQPTALSIPEIYDAINAMADGSVAIDWAKVEDAVGRRSGIPTIIGTRD